MEAEPNTRLDYDKKEAELGGMVEMNRMIGRQEELFPIVDPIIKKAGDHEMKEELQKYRPIIDINEALRPKNIENYTLLVQQGQWYFLICDKFIINNHMPFNESLLKPIWSRKRSRHGTRHVSCGDILLSFRQIAVFRRHKVIILKHGWIKHKLPWTSALFSNNIFYLVSASGSVSRCMA